MEFYVFEPRFTVALSFEEVRGLVGACGSLASVNLGLSKVRVEVEGGVCGFRFGSRFFSVDDLLEVSRGVDPRSILVYVEGLGFVRAEMWWGRFYKLVNVPGGAPTLEIDGIHMHRVEDVTPWEDARLKVGVLSVKRGSRVLDVCTGLGYTAINALRMGASEVHTIEVDENVLSMAELNPWSSELSSEKIRLILGDALEVLEELEEESYTHIIHDPPRLSKSTGELYSIEIHRKLYKLLEPGGKLYHYTGEPGRTRGANTPAKIASRLKQAGFQVKGYDRRAQGVIAFKPGKPR
ncbi:MAG: methyltransferase [Thermoprotei archaeon]|nr:methyltransferase [Thermoprotei archaeon]